MNDMPADRPADGPEPPLDLSALDPMRDEPGWRRTMDAVMARVDVVLADRALGDDPLDLIASWRRPLLAAAATVVAVLVPAEIALERREAGRERLERLVTISERWLGGPAPAGTDFLRAVGAPRTSGGPTP